MDSEPLARTLSQIQKGDILTLKGVIPSNSSNQSEWHVNKVGTIGAQDTLRRPIVLQRSDGSEEWLVVFLYKEKGTEWDIGKIQRFHGELQSISAVEDSGEDVSSDNVSLVDLS